MAAINLQDLTIPDDETTASAADAAEALATHLRRRPTPSGRFVLVVDDAPEVKVSVPAPAFKLLIEVLGELAKGNAVTVAPFHKELTTQQAAELLNVSRPYFVSLLEAGVLPYRKVGTHRRVRLTDVLAYQRADDERRREAQHALTRDAEDLGLYDS
jgi:excisionase family DNA binding protein